MINFHDLSLRDKAIMFHQANMGGGGDTLNSYYSALYDSWTNKPGDTLKAAQAAQFDRMTARTYWSKFDAAWFFGLPSNNDDGEALKNIVSPGTNDATAVNSPYWNMFSGYKGDGASSYINLNWNGSDDGSKFKLNDASFGVYGLDSVEDVNYKGHGVYEDTSLFVNSSKQYFGYINSDSYTAGNANEYTGLMALVRSASNVSSVYMKGVFDTEADVSTAINNADLPILKMGASYSDERIGFAFVGGALTEAECQQLEADLDYWFNFEWLSLGSELVTNGDFASADGWALDDGWEITGGKLVATATTLTVEQDCLESDKYYLITLDVDSIAGGTYSIKAETFISEIGSTANVGTLRMIIKTTGTKFRIDGVISLTGVFDNISIKEIIGLTV